MGRHVKRTRVTASKHSAINITVRPEMKSDGKGASWLTFLVQGWKEGGKWKRKRFKDEKEAQRFAALKRIEMENQGREQRMVLSPLTDSQHDEAHRAFELLGDTYSLTDAVAFFLKHHRAPDFTIRLEDALRSYLEDKTRDGIRDRSVKGIKSVVSQFVTVTDNPFTHEVTPQAVEAYLRGLRAKDGTHSATRKTWNNYRNDLSAFFDWCGVADASTNRPFVFSNPVTSVRKFSARQVREGQSAKPITTSPENTLRLFSGLMQMHGGVLLRYYAYLYFAGIRPEELKRLSDREEELVNLETGTITIPASISKTAHERQIQISNNLAAWLAVAPSPIIPANFDRLTKLVRKTFGLTHDEARHSFISYHVALHRSVGDAALQAGNSESIVKRHYLNSHSKGEGETFFRIVPDTAQRKADLSLRKLDAPEQTLKIV